MTSAFAASQTRRSAALVWSEMRDLGHLDSLRMRQWFARVICVLVGSAFVVDTPAQVPLPPTDVINTIAGDGVAGYSGDGGQAVSAQLSNPLIVAVDGVGNIFVVDNANNRIRKVAATTGIISTVAGSGTNGYSGDGGPATSAKLSGPSAVAVDASGNIYISDVYNSRIRKVNSSGVISTYAGNGTAGFSGDGGLATNAEINHPGPLVIDGAGNLYFSDTVNNRVRKVSTSGYVSTVAGGGAATGENVVATSAALNDPYGLALDSSGNLYICEYGGDRVRVVSSGFINTIAGNGTAGYSGDDGPALGATLSMPWGIAVDSAGDLFIADHGNSVIREVDGNTGNISTFAGIGVQGYTGDNGPASDAELFNATGVALDRGGNLYIADHNNNVVRAVGREYLPPPGIITTLAGAGPAGYSGDGGQASVSELSNSIAIAVDAAGNVFIADQANNRIREVSASTGTITTVAGTGTAGYSGDGGPATLAMIRTPQSVAVDAAGNLYFSDLYNQRVRKVSPNGIITTVAGNGTQGFSGDNGPAIQAELNHPGGLVIDAAGNIYLSDTDNNRIRLITPGGTITTVAGTGTASPQVTMAQLP